MRRITLPIIMTDTSALRDLMDVEMTADSLPPSQGGAQFSVPQVIDALCIKGQRTMMMPASILTELFPTLTGRLSLATDEHGHAQFPIGIDQRMFGKANQNALYHYFSTLAQQGQLRCYNSPAEMLAAGEVSTPKGGIVFVSMGEIRKPDGHIYSPNKATNLMTPPDEYVATKFNGPNKHKDAGDKDICQLLSIIDDYTQRFGVSARMMLFNTDGGLYRRLEGTSAENLTDFIKPIPLVDSMVELGMLHQKTRPALDNAVVELAQENRIWRNIVDRIRTPSGQDYLARDTEIAKRWIEATQPPEVPTKKIR